MKTVTVQLDDVYEYGVKEYEPTGEYREAKPGEPFLTVYGTVDIAVFQTTSSYFILRDIVEKPKTKRWEIITHGNGRGIVDTDDDDIWYALAHFGTRSNFSHWEFADGLTDHRPLGYYCTRGENTFEFAIAAWTKEEA